MSGFKNQQITKEEMIDILLKDIKRDLMSLRFGQVTVFVQNGKPSRKEIRISRTFRKTLDKVSCEVLI